MILDYNNSTGAFFLRVQRGEGDPQVLMKEYGLDLSVTATTASEAVLLTHEPYAAASFGPYATPYARAQLHGILTEIDKSWAPTSNANIKVPIDQELWPFQKASVAYALQRRNTLIADQPGLGKTPIAISFANEIGARRVLVICPANIRLQWARKIREWSTMPSGFLVYPIIASRYGVHPNAEWTIVSYDLARTEAIGRALARGHYDLLILDEAHYVKTVDSKRTRAIFGGGDNRLFAPFSDRSDRILGLTGTPLPNRPREAYTLARGLDFDAIDWMSEDKFKARFNPSMIGQGVRDDGTEYRYVDERSGRHAELQNRLRANFMVRHLKREVMPQLKLPVYDLVQVEETGPVKQALRAEALLDIDPEMLEGADAEVLGHIAVVRRQMGVAIAPQVADYAEMLLDGGEDKIVIFAWHIEVLNIIERKLARYGVLRIDGSTSATAKLRRVDQFVKDPSFHFMVGNTLSLGTGTDGLQAVSSHALLAEPEWVPGNNEQAIDRLDRGGQTRTVQADLFVAPNSILERILASALRKRQTTHKALDLRMV
jgi:SWI/SNF-related matrix-associated actin-dependent regulator of chromatin subfamily A-like protein 1